MMHAKSDEPLSMQEIAQILGVSLRSLQLAFAEAYGGLSPRDVLNRIRLEKARARLLAADGGAQATIIAVDGQLCNAVLEEQRIHVVGRRGRNQKLE